MIVEIMDGKELAPLDTCETQRDRLEVYSWLMWKAVERMRRNDGYMVKQANRTVVDEKDILSDNVYHYSRDDRRLDKASGEPNRGDMVAEGR